MTLYVRTNYVPEDCDYLTAGKLYEVTNISCNGELANIVCDNGITSIIVLGDRCTHIGKAWEQITLEDEQ
jgi:hypothetical protein